MFRFPFLFILGLVVCLNVQARPKTLQHAEFVYLSNAQKDDFVIKVMELAVDLEARYKHEVKVSGFNQERYERYTSLMKLISNFLMKSAYAQDDDMEGYEIDPSTMANVRPISGGPVASGGSAPRVTPVATSSSPSVPTPKVSSPPVSNIGSAPGYGVWRKAAGDFMSIMQGAAGSKCVYAGWASVVKRQTVPAGNGKVETRDICVHPKYIGGSPLPPEAQAYMDQKGCSGRNNITCNPALFGYKNRSEKSVFCVKAGLNDSENSSLACMKAALDDSPSINVDSKEARLKFLRESLVNDKSVFDGVQKFVYQTCVCNEGPAAINKGYRSRIKPHRTCYGLMEMMAKTMSCETEGSIDFDNTIFQKLVDYTNQHSSNSSEYDQVYISFLGAIANTDEYKRTCDPNSGVTVNTPPDDGNTQGGAQGGTGSGNDSTPPTTDGPKEYTCSATCKVAKASTPDKPQTDEDSPKPDNDDPAAPSKGADNGISCSYDITEKNSGSSVTSSTDITEVPSDSSATELTINATIDNKSTQVSCSVAFDNSDANTTPDGLTLKLSLGNKSDTTQKVLAKVSKEKEDRDGYTIFWYRKDFPSEKKKTEDKPNKKEPFAGNSAEPEDKPADKPASKDAPDEISDSSDKEEIEEPLKSASYKTCAKLQATGKEDIDGGCVTIPKLDVAQTPMPASVPQQQPMIPRASSSTSAMGIR